MKKAAIIVIVLLFALYKMGTPMVIAIGMVAVALLAVLVFFAWKCIRFYDGEYGFYVGKLKRLLVRMRAAERELDNLGILNVIKRAQLEGELKSIQKELGKHLSVHLDSLHRKYELYKYDLEWEQFYFQLKEGRWNEVEKNIEKVEEEHERLAREKLPQREHWQEHLLSIPQQEKGEAPVVTIQVDEDSYDAIVHGKNRRICVDYTREWATKLFSRKLKYVTLDCLGRGAAHGRESLSFKVKDIRVLENLTGKTGNPRKPPKGILPDAFAVDIVSDLDRLLSVLTVVAILAAIGMVVWHLI